MDNNLYDQASEVFQAIKETSTIALFLDFDGTLIPFANSPADVHIPQKVRTLLKKLAEHPQCRLAIITGRTLEEIKQLVAIKGLTYAAVHGWEIEFSSGEMFQWNGYNQTKEAMDAIKAKAENIFAGEQGVILEDKGVTMALHYRMVPQEKSKIIIDDFTRLVDEMNTNSCFQILQGSKVLEVRPRGWDKGKAVSVILESMETISGILPIYIGDDTTDEDAFRMLLGKGITIVVLNGRKRSTHATYSLETPSEVHRFLADVLDNIQMVH